MFGVLNKPFNGVRIWFKNHNMVFYISTNFQVDFINMVSGSRVSSSSYVIVQNY